MRKPQAPERRPSFREQYRIHVRAQILDLARTMMATGGEDSLTMTKLAEDIGLSIGSVYRYFTSRDDLIATLWLERIEQVAERVSFDSVTAREPLDELSALAQAWARAAHDDPAAVTKLAEALESVTSQDDVAALSEPSSLAGPLVDSVSRSALPGVDDRRGAVWRTAVLLRIIAATAAEPPDQLAEPSFAAETVTALVDRWAEPI